MNVWFALGLIALGMGIDAMYQYKIRVAECDAYKTGYEQGKREEQIKEDARFPKMMLPSLPGAEPKPPSMAANTYSSSVPHA
mgnify:CR=1 FL=1